MENRVSPHVSAGTRCLVSAKGMVEVLGAVAENDFRPTSCIQFPVKISLTRSSEQMPQRLNESN